MFNRLTGIGVLAIAGLVVANTAAAGAMRCGNHIIEDGGRTGPGMYEVLKKCGNPTAKVGTTWIYERGGTKKIVRFNDAGQVSRVTDG